MTHQRRQLASTPLLPCSHRYRLSVNCSCTAASLRATSLLRAASRAAASSSVVNQGREYWYIGSMTARSGVQGEEMGLRRLGVRQGSEGVRRLAGPDAGM
jgi:hypothetical protein